MRTTCEECGARIVLDEYDDIFVGKECKCGYYVTRYQPGMEIR